MRKSLKCVALFVVAAMLIATCPVVFADNSGSTGIYITRAGFVAKIADYFGWPHPSEYNDIWKAPLKQFNDVKTTDTFGKEIEEAYQIGIIAPDANGNFNPNSTISRQDAAVIFEKAFLVPDPGTPTNFTDEASISAAALPSVNALVDSGYMSGETSTVFGPTDDLLTTDAVSIFNKITTSMVSPVQALPVDDSTAPRRYITPYDPTPGTTIYFTRSYATSMAALVDPSTPTSIGALVDPTSLTVFNSIDQQTVSTKYNKTTMGQMKEDYTKQETTYVRYKFIAVDNNGNVSPVSTYTWHLYRPTVSDFQFRLMHAKTATSPAVYQICNDMESVRPMAYYIEGQTSGIIFDALQTSASTKNLKTYIDTYLATKPYICIVGHAHPDHDAQVQNFLDAGITTYCNYRGWSDLSGQVLHNAADQAKIKNIDQGDIFHLGGCDLNVYALPAHEDGLVMLQDKANGLIFATDIYGCTRAGSADNVNVSGVPADMLLSLAQQTYSNYKADGGKITELYTGHDETPLGDSYLKLFNATLQQVVDKGEAGCSPTLRGYNDASLSRTTLIGNMWTDGTNWCSLKLAGIMGDTTKYLSYSGMPYMNTSDSDWAINKNIDYNFDSNMTQHVDQYSQLSNIDITGGSLVGKTIAWSAPKTIAWGGNNVDVTNKLTNMFDPWSYNYTINVPSNNSSISIVPTSMSTNVKSIMVNGKTVVYQSSNTVAVSNGSVITIKVVAPDNVTTSNYTFTVVSTAATSSDNSVGNSSNSVTGNSNPKTGDENSVPYNAVALMAAFAAASLLILNRKKLHRAH